MRSKLLVPLLGALALYAAAPAGAHSNGTWVKNTWHLSQRGIFHADFRVGPNHSGGAKTFFLEMIATSSAELGKCKVRIGATTRSAKSIDAQDNAFYVTFAWPPMASPAKAVATCTVKQGLLIRVIAVFGRSEINLKHR